MTSDADARFIPGPPTAALPQLRVDSPVLVVRSPAAAVEIGELEAQSVGSFPWLWNDDEYWSFAKTDGTLLSLMLTIPEVNLESEPAPAPATWNGAPAATGTLRLNTLIPFSRPPATRRWFDAAGAHLFNFYALDVPEAAHAIQLHRIAIAEGTHLLLGDTTLLSDFTVLGDSSLLADSTLIGWSLADPARYLAGPAVPPEIHGTTPDPRLPSLLAEFFHLVTVDNIDRLDDGDQGLKRDLEHLAGRLMIVGAAGEPRAVEILNKLRQVLEDFGVDGGG